MQLDDVFNSLRRHWRMSLAILLLTGVALGLFLYTNDQVQPDEEWRASAAVLVPARDDKGERPEGVPPSLLQGQEAVALAGSTIDTALVGAGLSEGPQTRFEFGYVANEAGDIITLSVSGPGWEQVRTLAASFGNAFVEARKQSVSQNAATSQISLVGALVIYGDRLQEVDNVLRDEDPDLFAAISATDQENLGTLGSDPTDEASTTEGDAGTATLNLPASTPIDTVLLAAERQTLLTRIASTRASYAERSAEVLVPRSFATVVERPAPTQITERPSVLAPVLVAIAIGLVLALAAPVVVDRIDRSIRDAGGAAKAFAAPVLVTIPATSGKGRHAYASPGTEQDRSYRALAATSIATDELPRAVVVTAPVGDAQDYVAANFAAALAEMGLRVALVATDPRQSWYYDESGEPEPVTFPDLLALAHAGQLNGHVPDTLITSDLHNLRVLAPGEAAIDSLLDGLPVLLDAFVDGDIDITVIAGPSLLEDPAATIFAWSTRRVLWVVESGTVTEHQAHDAASRLELAGASPFGVALIEGKT